MNMIHIKLVITLVENVIEVWDKMHKEQLRWSIGAIVHKSDTQNILVINISQLKCAI